MPISVDCSHCGKTLKAKDSAAGKTAKCPSCQELITIPLIDEVYDAEEAGEPDAEFAGVNSYDMPAIPGEGRTACPACGEMIAERAKKCRHCGEFLDADLKRQGRGKKSSRSRRGDTAPLADLGKRFLASMADGLVGLLMLAPGLGLMIAGGEPEAPDHNETLTIAGGITAIIGFLGLMGLHIYLLATRSQTIGKYLIKIQIMDYETNEPAGFVKSCVLRMFVNGLVGAVAGCIPVIGGCYSLIDILFIFGEERRCIHDHIAGTYVADIS